MWKSRGEQKQVFDILGQLKAVRMHVTSGCLFLLCYQLLITAEINYFFSGLQNSDILIVIFSL